LSGDHKADVEAYIQGVADGSIVTGRLNRLAVWRHLEDLEKAGERGFYFDEQIAVDAIEFSLCCNQFQGEWAGQPLELRPEQKFIVWCVFGWRQKSDGMRRFRQAQIEVARKFGKSTMAAYLACLLLFADNPIEEGAQGYVAATKKTQAQVVWESAAEMIRRSPELAAEAVVKASMYEIKLPEFKSEFYPLAQDGDTVDGFNPHFIIKDEEHAYRKHMARFINTLSSGFGARRQPLTVTITTYGDETSDIWQSSHDYSVKVLESVVTGEVVDDSWFAFTAAIDREKDQPCFRCKGENCPWCGGAGVLPVDDPYDERCWVKANPGIGITPKLERMRESATQAKNRPDKESEFFQKNLNIVVSSKERFIAPELWGAGRELSDRVGVPGHGGIDLGRVNDFAAIAACWPFRETDDNGEDFTRYEIETKTWTVEDRPNELKTPNIARWISEGHLIAHDGDNVDFGLIQDEILAWNDKYTLKTWAFDPTFAGHMAQNLMAEGLEVFKFTQAHKYYTIPIEELRKLLGKSRTVNGVPVPMLSHNGCPVLAWQAGNLIIDRNARGERMPDKRNSSNKIDAMVAVLMALSECLYHGAESNQSIYDRESRGFVEIG
jgi:phage terminase large subunit-like protein